MANLPPKAEQRRATIAEPTSEPAEPAASQGGEAGHAAAASAPPEAATSTQETLTAQTARELTTGRNCGAALGVRMRAARYGRSIGLQLTEAAWANEQVGGSSSSSSAPPASELASDDVVLEALKPALSLTLPVPWMVQMAEGCQDPTYWHPGLASYEPTEGNEPTVPEGDAEGYSTSHHPLRQWHLELVQALREAVESTPDGPLLAPDRVRGPLLRLLQRMAGRQGLHGFGTWEEEATKSGKVAYVDRKIGLHRRDDPRLAAASQVGTMLSMLRAVWLAAFAGKEVTHEAAAFPFTEDEIWNVAEQLSAMAMADPKQRRRRRLSADGGAQSADAQSAGSGPAKAESDVSHADAAQLAKTAHKIEAKAEQSSELQLMVRRLREVSEELEIAKASEATSSSEWQGRLVAEVNEYETALAGAKKQRVDETTALRQLLADTEAAQATRAEDREQAELALARARCDELEAALTEAQGKGDYQANQLTDLRQRVEMEEAACKQAAAAADEMRVQLHAEQAVVAAAAKAAATVATATATEATERAAAELVAETAAFRDLQQKATTASEDLEALREAQQDLEARFSAESATCRQLQEESAERAANLGATSDALSESRIQEEAKSQALHEELAEKIVAFETKSKKDSAALDKLQQLEEELEKGRVASAEALKEAEETHREQEARLHEEFSSRENELSAAVAVAEGASKQQQLQLEEALKEAKNLYDSSLEELRRLQEALKNEKQRCETLELQASDASAEHGTALAEEMTSMREKEKQLETSLREQEEVVLQLRADLEASQETLKDAREHASTRQTAEAAVCEDLRKALAEVVAEAADANSEIQLLRDSELAMAGQLDELASSTTTSAEELAQGEQALRDRLEEETIAAISATKALQLEKEAVASLRTSLGRHEEEEVSLSTSARLEEEVVRRSLQAEVHAAGEQALAEARAAEELRRAEASLQGQLATEVALCHQQREQSAETGASLGALTAAIERGFRGEAEMQAKLHEEETACKQLQEEAASARKMLKEDGARLQMENQGLQADAKSATARAEAEAASMQQLKEDWERLQSEKQKVLADLEEAHDEAQKQAAGTEQLREEYARSKQEKQSLLESVQQAEEAIKMEAAVAQKLKDDCMRLQTEHSSLLVDSQKVASETQSEASLALRLQDDCTRLQTEIESLLSEKQQAAVMAELEAGGLAQARQALEASEEEREASKAEEASALQKLQEDGDRAKAENDGLRADAERASTRAQLQAEAMAELRSLLEEERQAVQKLEKQVAEAADTQREKEDSLLRSQQDHQNLQADAEKAQSWAQTEATALAEARRTLEEEREATKTQLQHEAAEATTALQTKEDCLLRAQEEQESLRAEAERAEVQTQLEANALEEVRRLLEDERQATLALREHAVEAASAQQRLQEDYLLRAQQERQSLQAEAERAAALAKSEAAALEEARGTLAKQREDAEAILQRATEAAAAKQRAEEDLSGAQRESQGLRADAERAASHAQLEAAALEDARSTLAKERQDAEAVIQRATEAAAAKQRVEEDLLGAQQESQGLRADAERAASHAQLEANTLAEVRRVLEEERQALREAKKEAAEAAALGRVTPPLLTVVTTPEEPAAEVSPAAAEESKTLLLNGKDRAASTRALERELEASLEAQVATQRQMSLELAAARQDGAALAQRLEQEVAEARKAAQAAISSAPTALPSNDGASAPKSTSEAVRRGGLGEELREAAESKKQAMWEGPLMLEKRLFASLSESEQATRAVQRLMEALECEAQSAKKPPASSAAEDSNAEVKQLSEELHALRREALRERDSKALELQDMKATLRHYSGELRLAEAATSQRGFAKDEAQAELWTVQNAAAMPSYESDRATPELTNGASAALFGQQCYASFADASCSTSVGAAERPSWFFREAAVAPPESHGFGVYTPPAMGGRRPVEEYVVEGYSRLYGHQAPPPYRPSSANSASRRLVGHEGHFAPYDRGPPPDRPRHGATLYGGERPLSASRSAGSLHSAAGQRGMRHATEDGVHGFAGSVPREQVRQQMQRLFDAVSPLKAWQPLGGHHGVGR
eukprot:TRINITY_DN19852_c0_g1_i1.p1 TRINITY_DN19852_c0_g1~~TRINITY_DN19852_c0_g1_i1.p1  ORF type:complete len:2066 (-),score=733.08 TRINITY_DN19852_c0_g1_i1:187-6384(-)